MKVNAFSKFYFTTTLLLRLTLVTSAQYVTLTAGPGRGASQTINIASNELATVLHLSTGYWVEGGQLEVVSGGITNSYRVTKLASSSETVGGFRLREPAEVVIEG